ncbi:oxidoreductase FAD/NAD(P)-binding domain protein [mine drainage metagenome]|uniref:Oxidoreductase FAD/NAD(P)-binding domain protein n=1 Tax=mine drainage metagenome TaxID=410659 RepID=T0YVN5_9ZZZZ
MTESPHKISVNQKPYVLTEILKDTPDVSVFRYKAQDMSTLSFDPGMFVMLTYIDKSTNEKITRAFSVASAPNSDTVDFFIHMVHGKLTTKLESARVGDVYYMTGPYGQFRFIPSQDKKVLFIAGGTGLAPFMSMLKEIDAQKAGTDIVLLYSIRFPNEIIRKDELEELEKRLNIRMVITVTRPQENDGWTGEKGHIDSNMIAKYASDLNERTTYICGPLAFVKAMKDALAGLNVNPDKIKADVWG